MPDDAGSGGSRSRALRPGSKTVTVAAVLLLLGGGTAVAVGLVNQDAAPTSPQVGATQTVEPSPSETAGALPAPSPGPTTSAPSGSTPSAAVPVPSESTPAPEPRILPAEIRIPSLGVISEVTQIGLNPDGTLAVPQPGPDYDKAAWYEGSPAPGQTGPAVIEGHVDSAANGPSVFYDLGKTSKGDVIEISREDGSVVTFVVDEVKAFPKDEFPTFDVYGNTDGPELRLITCGGDFNSDTGHYVNNTVVFASQA